MPGHNHYSSCTCGWCETRRGKRRRVTRSPTVPRLTFEQVTVPNASCPVCGACVFFYQNQYGSRVFFDDLGPPWPKHHCTDNANPSIGRRTRQAHPAARKPVRETGGWIPLRFLRLKFEDDWTVLYFETLEAGEFVRILTNQSANIPKHLPAYMLPWNRNDYTEIEFLDQNFSPHRIWGWKYGRWFVDSAASCLKLRRAQNEQAGQAG